MAKPEDPIDALFKLRLSDFTAARNALATQLKKRGLASEAARVKALDKPPVSAWTVNQLYWRHREEFDELIATGQRVRKAQTSGKMPNVREALEARRDALSQLSDLATQILSAAGHNPSLDTLRRITSTLEALSSYESLADEATPGRLTNDVDPPGFDSFSSFVPGPAAGKPASESRSVGTPKKTAPVTKTLQKAKAGDTSRREERQARIDAAKASLQSSKKALAAARVTLKSLQAAQRRTQAAAAEAEKQRRQAEERFRKATTAAKDAEQRSQDISAELAEATRTLDDATRGVAKASNELEKAFGESSERGRKTKSN